VRVDVRIVAATNRDLERAVADGQFREDLFFRLNVVSINLPPLRDRREEVPVLTAYFLKKYSVQYNKPFQSVSDETMRQFMDYDWPGNVRELENLIKRTVVLGSESTIRKEIQHGIALAAHRISLSQQPQAHSVGIYNGGANGHHGYNGHASAPQPAGRSNGSHLPDAVPPAAHATPASIAAAAAEAGNYSLKDISRTAAREAERELILRMLQQTRWNRKETAEILGISYKALLYKIKENGLDKAS